LASTNGLEAFGVGRFLVRRRELGNLRETGAGQTTSFGLPGTVLVKMGVRRHPVGKSLCNNGVILPPSSFGDADMSASSIAGLGLEPA